MSVKPILFNTEMVRAILDERKTVTRRAIKPKHKDPRVWVIEFKRTEKPKEWLKT